MPKIPGGQTGAPTVMIAEKAADIIIQSARTKESFESEPFLAPVVVASAGTSETILVEINGTSESSLGNEKEEIELMMVSPSEASIAAGIA
jgi:hypothetical protein